VLFVRLFFFSSRRRHTRSYGDWSSDVCSSDLRRMRRRERSSAPTAATACAGVGRSPAAAITAAGFFSAGWRRRKRRGRRRRCAQIGRASCREREEVWGGGGCGNEREIQIEV